MFSTLQLLDSKGRPIKETLNVQVILTNNANHTQTVIDGWVIFNLNNINGTKIKSIVVGGQPLNFENGLVFTEEPILLQKTEQEKWEVV